MFECLVFRGLIFFFKQKTAYEMRISDWSSDVCSSDLAAILTPFFQSAETPADRLMVEQAKWLAFTSKFWREFLSILLAGKTLTDDQMTERDKVVGGHAAADDDRCKCTIGHLVDSNREIGREHV